MGDPICVFAWVVTGNQRYPYRWDVVYRGANIVVAVYHAIRAKRDGAGCIKVEWR